MTDNAESSGKPPNSKDWACEVCRRPGHYTSSDGLGFWHSHCDDHDPRELFQQKRQVQDERDKANWKITDLEAALEAAEARIEKLKRQIALYELETETVKEVKAENAKLRDDMHALLSAIDEYQHDVLETRGRNPSRWLEQVIERIDRVLKVED